MLGQYYLRIMKFLLGKKLGMSQQYAEDGAVVPVTLIGIDDNIITQVKANEKEGYTAVQVGTGVRRKISKPLAGHLKDLPNLRFIKEFKVKDGEYKRGDKIDLSIFSIGDKVKVTGIMKGKGFAGAVKRHGFKGMPASHGHKSVRRHVGSIGQRFPQHTLKGMRMAGRMGGVQITTRGLKVVGVDKDNGTLVLKGAVPGNIGGFIKIESIN